MKLLLVGLLAASTLAIAAPVAAQGIYVGPGGGVGVGIGADPYYGDRYYRDGYADDPLFEGRSVYRDRYDDYDDF